MRRLGQSNFHDGSGTRKRQFNRPGMALLDLVSRARIGASGSASPIRRMLVDVAQDSIVNAWQPSNALRGELLGQR